MNASVNNGFLCSCTAELIRMTGLDPATCRAFANDFAPLLTHLSQRGFTPARAIRNGAVLGWAAMLANRDREMRAGRTCRKTETVGRAICDAVLRDRDHDPRLARLARAAMARAAASRWAA